MTTILIMMTILTMVTILTQSRRHGGLVGLDPQTQFQAPQIEI